MSRLVVDREHFGNLFEVLAAAGYTVVAPTLGDNAIDYAVVTSVADLPIGWTADQEAGTYRLRRRGDEALFGYAVGPQSWKRYLFPPRTTLFRVRREQGSVTFVTDQAPPARYAFVGVRACELAAIAVQDRVFLGARPDRTYHDARRDLFTVAVNCAVAGGTCFCVSMGTGPRCTTGYDLVLTEVVAPDRHEFVFESATEAGDRVLDALPGRPATPADLEAVDRVVAATAASMGRTIDTGGIEGLLPANAGHPRWDEVADRCLACTNCTLVCPTCFCSTTEDAVSLDGAEATRSRRWDSCFSLDFSAVHGVPVRQSTKARYRQWLTHKLSTWHDQFGTSGCVGCGRCITWCPVGIDITEEVAAIRSTPGGTS